MYTRICPHCGNEIPYKTEHGRNLAEETNKLCHICCQIPGIKQDMTPEHIKEIIEKNYPNFIVTDIDKNKKTAIFTCKDCGYVKNIGYMGYYNNRTKNPCPKCTGQLITIEDVRREIEQLNPDIELLSTEFKFKNDTLKWRCKKCGYEWEQKYKSLIRKDTTRNPPVCSKCSNRQKMTIKEFLEQAKSNTKLTIIDDFKRFNIYMPKTAKIKVKCNDCGHEWMKPNRDIILGTGCPNCIHTTSSHEIAITEWLKSFYKGEILTRQFFYNKERLRREVDIYLPKERLGIELNGMYFHSNIFIKDPNYHLEKYNLITENNIRLLQILDNEWINNREQCEIIVLDKLGTPAKNKTDELIFGFSNYANIEQIKKLNKPIILDKRFYSKLEFKDYYITKEIEPQPYYFKSGREYEFYSEFQKGCIQTCDAGWFEISKDFKEKEIIKENYNNFKKIEIKETKPWTNHEYKKDKIESNYPELKVLEIKDQEITFECKDCGNIWTQQIANYLKEERKIKQPCYNCREKPLKKSMFSKVDNKELVDEYFRLHRDQKNLDEFLINKNIKNLIEFNYPTIMVLGVYNQTAIIQCENCGTPREIGWKSFIQKEIQNPCRKCE